MEEQVVYEPSPVFDNLDVDLVVKVLSNTLFSPAFLAFVPIFYIFQGAKWTDSVVLYSVGYCAAVSAFCTRLFHC